MRTHGIGLFAICLSLAAGCNNGGTGAADMATPADMALVGDPDMGCALTKLDTAACKALNTDYQPRVNMSKDDPWPACISDDNSYHQIGMSTPGGAARVTAWDTIAGRLFRRNGAPSADDFLMARNDFTAPNGISSRMERRQDIHYPEIPNNNKLRCADQGIPAMYPDRCAGPAKLLPIMNDAFTLGLAGTKPLVQAARIEAALLWFFYISELSEQWTCQFEAVEDCDGVWGHYNAAQQRAKADTGLSRYFSEINPAIHDRVFDAILAVRCWRDLDKGLPSTDAAKYKLSLDQVDRAELFGVVQVVRARLDRLSCDKGEAHEADLAFIKIIGDLLDRPVRALDTGKADQLKTTLAKADLDARDIPTVRSLLDSLFPCP